ncbi:MAG: hypothetical protein FWE95_05125 [Planctomycetaceae bacterium]|nr:hypothetical protein [Planctomycetaceae bacterium]
MTKTIKASLYHFYLRTAIPAVGLIKSNAIVLIVFHNNDKMSLPSIE